MENLKKVSCAQLCLFALFIGFAFLMQNCQDDDAIIYEENQIKTELNARPVKVTVCRYNERKGTYSEVTVVEKRVLPGDVIIDADGDGYVNYNECGIVGNGIDCDDTNADITIAAIFYRDADNDTFGDPNDSYEACVAPEGYVTDNTDCDDNDSTVNPGAVEICGDFIDNNCNGETDEGCAVGYTYVPDDNFEAYLEANGMGDGTADNDWVLYANINTVTELYISSLGISDLTGIEDFAALETLHCANNLLTSLDLSHNTELLELNCSYNYSLATIDVSNSLDLDVLDCGNNILTTLNVSNNPILTYLDCTSNQISELDLSSNTYLAVLYCRYNNLQNLDLSTNDALVNIYCNDNQIKNLDVTNKSYLQELDCYNNQLQYLDVSNNIYLTKLSCNSNQINVLNVSNNDFLYDFDCRDNTDLHCIQVNSTQFANIPSGWWKDDDAYYYIDSCS